MIANNLDNETTCSKAKLIYTNCPQLRNNITLTTITNNISVNKDHIIIA